MLSSPFSVVALAVPYAQFVAQLKRIIIQISVVAGDGNHGNLAAGQADQTVVHAGNVALRFGAEDVGIVVNVGELQGDAFLVLFIYGRPFSLTD